MNQGRIIFDGNTKELFKNKEVLEKANLIPPQIVQLSHVLDLEEICLSIDDIYKSAEKIS